MYMGAECHPLSQYDHIFDRRYQDVVVLRDWRTSEAMKAQNVQGLIAPYRRPLKFRER